MHIDETGLSLLWGEAARIVGRTSKGYMGRYGIMSDLLTACWCRETCVPRFAERWMPSCAGLGQDDVTAIAVRAAWGGKIAMAGIDGHGPHYFNVLPNGEGVARYDFTRPFLPRGCVLGPQHFWEADQFAAWRASKESALVLRAERSQLLMSRMTESLKAFLAQQR